MGLEDELATTLHDNLASLTCVPVTFGMLLLEARVVLALGPRVIRVLGSNNGVCYQHVGTV
jgi:hypothetical protein